MGALDGIRVIDFGQYIAGPMTGMLLADQGAQVIKVDPPGGPTWDAPANSDLEPRQAEHRARPQVRGRS